MISTLDALGGFGNGRLQIDFSLHVVHAAPDAPTRTIVSHPNGYFFPDCEPLGTAMPVPLAAAIEGQTGLACDNLSGDCHLLVVQDRILYETFASTAAGETQLEAQCLAVGISMGSIRPRDAASIVRAPTRRVFRSPRCSSMRMRSPPRSQ